jgi:hypothetical protein
MRRPQSPIVLRAGVILVTIVLAFSAGGCVTNGDFGRVRPELTADDMHDWVGRDAVGSIGGIPSEFRTTDDERQLRDRAYALIEPPYNRQQFDSVFREYGLGRKGRDIPLIDPTLYLARLHQTYRRSEASAYAQIVTDARNDVERLGPFFANAARVLDMDGRRLQSMALVSDVSPGEQINAVSRTAENKAIVGWVCRAIKARIAAYRFALERLVIAVPSQGAAEADRTIGLLQRQLAASCTVGGATVVTARG